MARSYSFDHFSSHAQSPGRNDRREAKQKLHETEAAPPEHKTRVRYGHKFAETESKLHAAHEAAVAGSESSSADAERFAPQNAASSSTTNATQPFMLLWEDVRHSAETFVHATHDARLAALRLVRAPWDFARTAGLELRRRVWN